MHGASRIMKIPLGDIRAVTLIELLIVIFIISLVLASILPTFSGFGSNDVTDDARLVASVIRYLDDTSRNTREQLTMVLDLDEKTVSYPGDTENVLKKIGSLYSVKLTSDEEKKSGMIQIDFPPSGLSERLRVMLSGDSEFMTVLYNPYSGRVIIEKEAG